jgi:hypothetical protein
MCWLRFEKLLPRCDGKWDKKKKKKKKPGWYAVLQKQEHEVLGNTTRMMAICDRLRGGETIEEICQGITILK